MRAVCTINVQNERVLFTKSCTKFKAVFTACLQMLLITYQRVMIHFERKCKIEAFDIGTQISEQDLNLYYKTNCYG